MAATGTGRWSALAAFALMASLGAAAAEREPGAMLRDGVWGEGAGQFDIPQALRDTPPAAWPASGWVRLSFAAESVLVEPVVAEGGGVPSFLAAIVAEIGRPAPDVASVVPEEPLLYLRVPGASLVAGSRAAYVFRNQSLQLRPKLDYRYELSLGGQPFAVTVHNGLKGPGGAPYGGAHYVVEYDGSTYDYVLGEFGWDSTIEAIADLDGDGKPDFIVAVGGTNSGYEAVLLSTQAKPGRNVATASLVSHGC